MIKSEFRRAGVTIIFASQGIISGHPRDKLQEGIYEVINEHRSDELGMMVADACRAKYERGGVNGKPPLGYQRYHGEPGDPRNGSLVIDEAGAETVRLIYRALPDGRSLLHRHRHQPEPRFRRARRVTHTTRLGHPFTKGFYCGDPAEPDLPRRDGLGTRHPRREVRVGRPSSSGPPSKASRPSAPAAPTAEAATHGTMSTP